MSSPATIWTVQLTDAARDDFLGIVRWTAEHFGELQARVYSETILGTLTELASGPDLLGVKRRDDIIKGMLTIHVARRGRRGRHFILFRLATDSKSVIEVLRFLHDSMDPQLHIPGAPE